MATGPAPDPGMPQAARQQNCVAGAVCCDARGGAGALVAAEPEEPDGAALVPAHNPLHLAGEFIDPFEERQPAADVETRIEALVILPGTGPDGRGRGDAGCPPGVDDEQRVDRGRRR